MSVIRSVGLKLNLTGVEDMSLLVRRSLILAMGLLISVQVNADQGFIEKNGVRMPVKDTLITYDKKQSQLSIFLFPSRLSSQEKQEIAKKNDTFSVLWKKPSPDTKKWQWYPYAMLRLTGKNGKVNDVADISHYYLLAYGIAEKHFTDNLNGYFSNRDKPDNYKKRGSNVELKYSGMEEFTKVKWNLNIRAQAR